MSFPSIQCGKCSAAIRPELFSPGVPGFCPLCGTGLRVVFFPAFFRPATAAGPAPGALAEGESGCFFHPARPALHPCDGCGRFLCALCSIDFAGRQLCPACLEAGKVRGKMADLENRRVLYDNIALSVTLLPLTCVGIYFTFITAPLAVALSIWFWNRPTSLFRRVKWRFMLAFALGLLESLGVVWVIYQMVQSFRSVK